MYKNVWDITFSFVVERGQGRVSNVNGCSRLRKVRYAPAWEGTSSCSFCVLVDIKPCPGRNVHSSLASKGTQRPNLQARRRIREFSWSSHFAFGIEVSWVYVFFPSDLEEGMLLTKAGVSGALNLDTALTPSKDHTHINLLSSAPSLLKPSVVPNREQDIPRDAFSEDFGLSLVCRPLKLRICAIPLPFSETPLCIRHNNRFRLGYEVGWKIVRARNIAFPQLLTRSSELKFCMWVWPKVW